MSEIRKEILIAAPIARVWEHLTDSKKMTGWFLPNDFEPRVGKRFTLACEDEGRIDCEVREVVPQRKLVYTFKSRDMPVATTVSFALERTGTGTRVTLVHSGWEGLEPGQVDLFGMFEQGWQSRFLVALQSALEDER
jgi:uncharacterized protein YndB with AHSA1/START domain